MTKFSLNKDGLPWSSVGVGTTEDSAEYQSITGLQTYGVTLTGTPAAVTVGIEGSLNGTNWETLALHSFSAAEIANEYAMFHITNKIVGLIRANVTVLTLNGASDPATVSIDVRIS